MLYLIATILLNTALFLYFKVFPKYKIDAFQAIVANYITCSIVGSLLRGNYPVNAQSIDQPWFPWSLLMGTMFFGIFNLMSYCTEKDGITTTTVANKLSLVIPFLFSVFLYDEKLTALKLAGVVIALPAVYFTTRVKEENKPAQNFLLPALLFVCSGLLDTLVAFVEKSFLPDARSTITFTIHAFSTAAIIGTLVLAALIIKGKKKFHIRHVVAGVLLGIPNYFSIYCLVRMLNSGFLQSSAAIPVNNIGIVLVGALSAIFIFKEKASPMRILGLVLSIVAIMLLALGDFHGRSI